MKQNSTAERLREIMLARGLRQVDLLAAAQPYCQQYGVRLGKNALSQYLSGRVVPGQDKLTILALTLNVSEAWLMGYDVPQERATPTIPSDDERCEEYVRLFSQLSPENQGLILQVIKALLSAQ